MSGERLTIYRPQFLSSIFQFYPPPPPFGVLPLSQVEKVGDGVNQFLVLT